MGRSRLPTRQGNPALERAPAGALPRRRLGEVRPSYGSILVPLFEEDGLRMGELARRARLSKQTMTTMVRLLEREQLVRRERDPDDERAFRIVLTAKARRFEPVAEHTLAELGALALEQLGERRLASVKQGLKEWIER